MSTYYGNGMACLVVSCVSLSVSCVQLMENVLFPTNFRGVSVVTVDVSVSATVHVFIVLVGVSLATGNMYKPSPTAAGKHSLRH